MPCRIAFCSASTRIVSVTARSPLRSTVTSLTKRRMRSAASARPPATPAISSVTASNSVAARVIRRPTRRPALAIIDDSRLGRRKRHARRRRLRAVVELEEGFCAEAEHPGHEVVRKRLDRDVEVAHRAVVVAPRHLQLVLDAGQLLLQGEEVL